MGQDLARQPAEGFRLVGNPPDLRGRRAGEQPGGGDGILVHVEEQICDMLCHGWLLRVRLSPPNRHVRPTVPPGLLYWYELAVDLAVLGYLGVMIWAGADLAISSPFPSGALQLPLR